MGKHQNISWRVRRVQAVVAATAVSGALIGGAVGQAPVAGATCLSLSGFNLGNGCESAPFSVALGLGPHAKAKAVNPLDFAIGIGRGAGVSSPVTGLHDLVAGIVSAFTDIIDWLTHPGGVPAKPEEKDDAGTKTPAAGAPVKTPTGEPGKTPTGEPGKTPTGEASEQDPGRRALRAGVFAALKIDAAKTDAEKQAAIQDAINRGAALDVDDASLENFFQDIGIADLTQDEYQKIEDGVKQLRATQPSSARIPLPEDDSVPADKFEKRFRDALVFRRDQQIEGAGKSAAQRVNAAKSDAERKAALSDAAKELAALDGEDARSLFTDGFFDGLDGVDDSSDDADVNEIKRQADELGKQKSGQPTPASDPEETPAEDETEAEDGGALASRHGSEERDSSSVTLPDKAKLVDSDESKPKSKPAAKDDERADTTTESSGAVRHSAVDGAPKSGSVKSDDSKESSGATVNGTEGSATDDGADKSPESESSSEPDA